ncbi:O-antigen ligase family protein [bacterium]|nr:O-antigen ligase family protein [bacterium]MBU1652479.1 O-antigen ligase family protein [bacterium]MBU1880577.1 O-antigen ligase family protein [bacterium]
MKNDNLQNDDSRIDPSSVFFKAWIALCLIYPLTILVSIAATNLILVPIVIGAIVFRREFTDASLKTFSVLVLAYLVWSLIAVMLSPYDHHWSSWVEERSVFLAILPGLVIGSDIKRVIRSFRYVSVYLFIIAIYATLQYWSGINWVDGKALHISQNHFRAQGLQNNALTFAGMIALSMPLTVAVWRQNSIVSGLAILSGAFSGLASMSRAIMLGFIGGGSLITLLGTNRFRIFGALLVVLMLVLPRTLFVSRMGEKDETRLYIYKSTVEIIKHHALTGVGENNWRPAFAKYGLEYDHKNWPPTHAHSDILTCTVENGLIGTLIFLALWGYIMSAILKSLLRSKELRRDILAGIFTSLAMILFAGLFQNFQTDAENALLLWFVVGMGMRLAINTDMIKGDQ